MSQQPPYGSPPPPPGSYQPYGPGGYPPEPPRSDHTARNVIIVVVAVIALLCAGVVYAVLRIVGFVGDSIDDARDAVDYPGSEGDPLVVERGEAFEIRGFRYDAGWRVVPGPEGAIEGVRGTNRRTDEDSESVHLVFTVYLDNEKVAEVRCDDPGPVRFERSVTLDCTGLQQVPARFDTVEVYDNSLFE